MSNVNEQRFCLTYLDRFDIENEEEGLSEPSGLALSHGKNALWTISDDTEKVFKMTLDSDLNKDKSFEIPDKGLEGITLDPTGKFLFVVKEEYNEIIQIEVDAQQVVNRQRLAEMAGYDAVAQYFTGGGANKGSRASPGTTRQERLS